MPFNVPPTQISSYLNYLPAIVQQEGVAQGVSFIGRFLLAFEKILSGLGDPAQPGLEEIIGQIHIYFDPGPGQPEAERAPADFLPWLAGWVALTLRDDWEEEEKRRFISRIVPIYRKRGTKDGLIEILRAYVGSAGVEINEFRQPFQIGVTSTVGVDTMVGGGPPHYFLVKIILPGVGDLDFDRKEQIARAIVDREKPAHTYYDLGVEFPPTMQIGRRSTVGVNTLLGSLPPGS